MASLAMLIVAEVINVSSYERAGPDDIVPVSCYVCVTCWRATVMPS